MTKYGVFLEIRSGYYSFGSPMPGRVFSSPTYRYGFNGKEKTDEVTVNGGNYDYGFRFYDSRLGRFLSVDPLSNNYPWYTPYQFAGNKPIKYIDVDGLEEGEDPVSSFFSYLSTAAANYVEKKVEEVCNYTVTKVKEYADKVNVTPYAKVEGQYSIGARVTTQTKGGLGFDANAGSVVIAKAGVKTDNKTPVKEAVYVEWMGKNGSATMTQGGSAGVQGPLGPVIVGVSGGGGVATTKSKDGTSKSYSANTSVSVNDVNVTGAGQVTKTDGKTTSASATLSVGKGGSIGVIGTFDYTIELGYEISIDLEEE